MTGVKDEEEDGPPFRVQSHNSNTLNDPKSFIYHQHHHPSGQHHGALGTYIESEDEELISDDTTSFGGLAEARHFESVCQALSDYSIDSMREVARMEMHFNSISDDDKLLLIEDIDSRITKIKEAVMNNQNFLDLILIDQGQSCEEADLSSDLVEELRETGGEKRKQEEKREHNAAQEIPERPTTFRNISKVRSTLRQFVRDWSDEVSRYQLLII